MINISLLCSVISLTLPAGPADRFLQMCFALIGCLNSFLTGLAHHVSYFSLMMLNKVQRIVGGALYIRRVHLSASWQGGEHPSSEIYLYICITDAALMVKCQSTSDSLQSSYGSVSQQRWDGHTDKRQGRKKLISISGDFPVQHTRFIWHISAGHKTSHSII